MEIDEQGKKLKLGVRRKKTGLTLICSRCGQHVPAARIHEVCEREVRDLPCFEYTTTVVVETYRVKCPRCGIRAERVARLPSKAPYSKRFEEAVGQACESAAVRQVARHMGLAASTVRTIDQRYLEPWDARRRQSLLRQVGVDEIYRGKKGKFLTVVCVLNRLFQLNRRVFKARCDVDQTPGRHLELLPDQGALWRSRGSQREHSHVDQLRAGLSESSLPAAEGQADVGFSLRARLPKLNRIAFGIVQTSKSSVWIKLLINVYCDSSGT
jgi:transposase